MDDKPLLQARHRGGPRWQQQDGLVHGRTKVEHLDLIPVALPPPHQAPVERLGERLGERGYDGELLGVSAAVRARVAQAVDGPGRAGVLPKVLGLVANVLLVAGVEGLVEPEEGSLRRVIPAPQRHQL